MFHQGNGLLPLWSAAPNGGSIGLVEQLYQGGGQLLGPAALGLALESVPVTVTDHQLAMQGFGGLAAAFGPAVWGGHGRRQHWTQDRGSVHPDGMQQQPRSPFQPIRWLHQLAGLMAQVSQAERLKASDDSLRARRLRQRMALAQRVLDPLPQPLQSEAWAEQVVWTGLRWGGLGLLLAVWLKR